ncbi:hypothetical protein [Dyadobacter sp. LHD-138]|uniref:hypothetical protein n=1 Tax=Dyadobacter sp. LHD-138 TaxID=3071413 RepID=UPI0027DFF6CE|nr:hypothetical protein [Dyadobacter sp. LHD-138]MDQ6478945.1 hypothetical protein [Dyadobacter sp. LHD-138]
MEKKKRIKIYNTFEELETDQIQIGIEMSLQERFEAFFQMRKFHDRLFSIQNAASDRDGKTKKRILISKPGWI